MMGSLFSLKQLDSAPVTTALLITIALVYLGQQVIPNVLENAGVLYGPAVAQGQWWRVLTSAFLHGGLIHVGFNGYLLFAIGPELERGIGSQRFALLYFGALFGASLTVMLLGWRQPTLGASGAVLGIAAGMAMIMWSRGVNLVQTPTFGLVLLNLFLPLLVPGISFLGHLGGVVTGCLLAAVLLGPQSIRRGQQSSAPPSPKIALIVVVVLAVLSVVAAQFGLSL